MTTIRLHPLVAACAPVFSAVFASVCATQAHAGPSQADLERTRLYGEVSIAQDSVNSWGVWEQFEPPAAGPNTPVVSLAPRGDLYRPLGTVTTNTTPVTPTPPVAAGLCASGALCGFGVFADTQGERDPSAPYVASDRFAFVTRPVSLTDAARAQAAALIRVNWEPSSMQMFNEALNGGSLEADSGRMSNDGAYYGWDNGGARILYTDRKAADDGTGITNVVEVARLSGVYKYVSGETTVSKDIFAFWGVTTPAAAMDALNRSNVQTTYQGRTYDGSQTVTMAIDFGQGKITAGQFGSGVDGKVVAIPTTSGGTQLTGAVGFTFTGEVVGSNFRSTSVQAADARAISGSVQGAFFGSGAQAAAGVADVVKTRAGEGGYTNGKYTDAFITYKQDQAR